MQEALELHRAFRRRPADWRRLVLRLGLSGQLGSRFGRLSGDRSILADARQR